MASFSCNKPAFGVVSVRHRAMMIGLVSLLSLFVFTPPGVIAVSLRRVEQNSFDAWFCRSGFSDYCGSGGSVDRKLEGTYTVNQYIVSGPPATYLCSLAPACSGSPFGAESEGPIFSFSQLPTIAATLGDNECRSVETTYIRNGATRTVGICGQLSNAIIECPRMPLIVFHSDVEVLAIKRDPSIGTMWLRPPSNDQTTEDWIECGVESTLLYSSEGDASRWDGLKYWIYWTEDDPPVVDEFGNTYCTRTDWVPACGGICQSGWLRWGWAYNDFYGMGGFGVDGNVVPRCPGTEYPEIVNWKETCTTTGICKTLPWTRYYEGPIAVVGEPPVAPPPVPVDPAPEPPAPVNPGTEKAWAEQQELFATDGKEKDEFGRSVAIHQDTIVVGAPHDVVDDIEHGSAYVFIRSNGAWMEAQKLIASDADFDDYFGAAVAVYEGTAVIGARYGDSGGAYGNGSVYIFTRQANGHWIEEQKIVIEGSETNDKFGAHVAIDGQTLVVGETYGNDDMGSAYVYVKMGDTWTLETQLVSSSGVLKDEFGKSVGIHGDTVVVGATGHFVQPSISGYAIVFQRKGGVWDKGFELRPDDGFVGDEFGRSVAIDGDTIVVGNAVIGDGAASYIFQRMSSAENSWTQIQKLNLDGYALTMSGDTLISERSVFRRSPNGLWEEQEGRLVPASDPYASRVWAAAMSGSTAVLGDPWFGNRKGSIAVFIEQTIQEKEIIETIQEEEMMSPDNDYCENAIDVSVPASGTSELITGSTENATFVSNRNVRLCPPLKSPSRSVWYRVVGTGHTFTATTCHDATTFLTALIVLDGACSSSSNQQNVCIGGSVSSVECLDNDSGTSFSWETDVGHYYYIGVYGRYRRRRGAFGLSIFQTINAPDP